MESDPFALDQQALEEKLKALQKHFQRWRQLRAAAESADGSGAAADQEEIAADLLQDELQWLTGELQRGVKSLAWEVKDLGETLTAMTQGAAAAAPPTGANRGRARFLGNARSLLASIEAELAAPDPRSSSGAADELQQQQQPQQQPLTASDAELLLATDTVELEEAAAAMSPRIQRGGLRGRAWALAKRHRAPLACIGCLLFLAFVLWVFYEAVLHGGRQECLCTGSSGAATTVATDTAATATTTAAAANTTASETTSATTITAETSATTTTAAAETSS